MDTEEYRLIQDGLPDLLPMTDRSPGAHVSHIIHYLCVKLKHYTPSDTGPAATRMGLGSAFEHALVERFARHYPDRYLQIGELYKDGLYGTPDLVDTLDWSLHEIKLTWSSSRHGPDSEKYWRYWVQVKAYCWMLETTVGRLHVCHVNGDYTYGREGGDGGPVYRVWEREFTVQELAENWAMLKTNEEAASRYRLEREVE